MVVTICHFRRMLDGQASDYCSLSYLRHVSRSDNVGQMTCSETQDPLTSTFLLRLEEPTVFDPNAIFQQVHSLSHAGRRATRCLIIHHVLFGPGFQQMWPSGAGSAPTAAGPR